MRTCCFLHTNIPDTSFLCSLLTSILGTCMIYQVDFGKAVLYKNCNVSGKPTQAYNLLMVSRVFWQLKSSDQQRPPSTDFLARPRGLQCSSGRFKNRWPRSKDKVAFETGGKGLPYVFFFGRMNQSRYLLLGEPLLECFITAYPHARNRTTAWPHPQTHRISRSWRRLHGRRSSQGFWFYETKLKC